jgi:DNA-binding NtrC family response regulator
MDKQKISNTAQDDSRLLEALIPGRGESIQTIRDQILSFACNTSTRGALLLGPIGSGKSTVARVMALMRYLYFCSNQVRRQIIDNLRFDGPFRVDKKFLDFYEEMNLTGLVSNLAQAQLFGVAKGAATQVSEKPGIFEQAMTGHGKPSLGSEITRGVVFLDEIGDLSPELQPILLSVVTGSEVYRVGGEGNPEYGYSFNGTVIAATWKNPFDGILRHDLLSRLANQLIRLPGLNQRKDEMEEIALEIAKDILARHGNRMEEVERVGGNEISRERIKAHRKLRLEFGRHAIELLRKQDWDKLGDLRGLRQVLERCFHDQVPVSKALEQAVSFSPPKQVCADTLARSMIDNICDGGHASSLREEVRRIERLTRETFASHLQNDNTLLRQLAKKTGLSQSALKRQLSELTRNRSKKKS